VGGFWSEKGEYDMRNAEGQWHRKERWGTNPSVQGAGEVDGLILLGRRRGGFCERKIERLTMC